MSRLHILLVSDQLLGNVIPTLMERPDQAALIVTPTMRPQAKRLTEVLEGASIRVRRFDNAPDVDLPKLEEYALDVISQLAGAADELVLNLTGGTKLMAIGFLDVLRDEVHRCVYTDTAHGRLELLPIGERRQSPQPLESVLDVPTYLLAQGFRVRKVASKDDEWLEIVEARKAVTKWLADRAPRLGSFLGALNAVAAKALSNDGEELCAPEQTFDKPIFSADWKNAMERLCAEGMLDWEGGTQVVFLDADRTRYLNGGWLEEYVYHRLVDEGVEHVAFGVTGTWEKAEARNEFDVVAVHANRLLVIECKTSNQHFDSARTDQQFYKLDSLGQDARGLFGETWFVTAREPTADSHERAKQHGIEILGPDRLPRLRDEVRRWLASVTPGPE